MQFNNYGFNARDNIIKELVADGWNTVPAVTGVDAECIPSFGRAAALAAGRCLMTRFLGEMRDSFVANRPFNTEILPCLSQIQKAAQEACERMAPGVKEQMLLM